VGGGEGARIKSLAPVLIMAGPFIFLPSFPRFPIIFLVPYRFRVLILFTQPSREMRFIFSPCVPSSLDLSVSFIKALTCSFSASDTS
jgi:hypothetical protein